MSMQAINYAMTLPVDETGPRFLLFLIAHHINWKTGTMYVSQEELAAEARISSRTCRRWLIALEKAEFIRRTERRDERGFRINDEIELLGYLEWQAIIYNGGELPDPNTRGKRIPQQPDKLSGSGRNYRTGDDYRTNGASLPDKSCKPTGHCCPVYKEPLLEPLPNHLGLPGRYVLGETDVVIGDDPRREGSA